MHTSHYDDITGTRVLPLSAILLLLMAYTNLWITDLVPGLGWLEQTLPRVLMIVLAISYFLLIWATGPASTRATVFRARRWRTILALAMIVLNVLTPTALFMRDRLQRGPYPENVIDWPLQIEAGSRLLLNGQSPYGVDYSGGEMSLWSNRANFPDNPALRHAIHLPVNFILGVIGLSVSEALTGWYDARVLLITAYLAVLLIAPKLASNWEDGHALQIGLAMNPLLAASFAVGLSDFLLLAWVVLALALRRRGHVRAAAAIIGVAVATRQFSWLLLPIYAAAEWFALPHGSIQHRLRLFAYRMWPLPVVAGAAILPFFLANPAGFYADVIAFGSGGIADAYPMGGPKSFGISVIVLALGWARSQNDQFPFTLLQLLATVPTICYAIWMQGRRNTISRMLFSYLVILAVFLFTGRFMHNNYVGYLFSLALLTYFTAETPLESDPR